MGVPGAGGGGECVVQRLVLYKVDPVEFIHMEYSYTAEVILPLRTYALPTHSCPLGVSFGNEVIGTKCVLRTNMHVQGENSRKQR